MAHFLQEGHYFIAIIPLNDDFTILNGTAHAHRIFQFFCKGFDFLGVAFKTFDEGDCFSGPSLIAKVCFKLLRNKLIFWCNVVFRVRCKIFKLNLGEVL